METQKLFADIKSIKISKRKIAIILMFCILVAGNIFFGVEYFILQNKCKTIEKNLALERQNGKVINFSRLFIEKVLKAEGEVSFEERLKLENAVRDLNDSEVLVQWEKFTGSKTEAIAQQEVKNLLSLLVNKISQ